MIEAWIDSVDSPRAQSAPMIKYDIFPIVEGEPEIPLNPEPVGLREAFSVIDKRVVLLEAQGYWRGCRGRAIPVGEIGFSIRPAKP